MRRIAGIGISVIAFLAIVVTPPLVRRFKLTALTPSELAAKQPTPPAPPDEGCAQIQRALADSSNMKPVRNTSLFGADEVALYRDILERWNTKPRELLNVSNRTLPIDRDLSSCGCLKDLDVQDLAHAAHSFRILTGDVLSSKNIRLVDADKQDFIVRGNDPIHSIHEGKSIETAVRRAFSTGIFSVSEIAFDKEHRRALLGYRFACGSLCGSGGALLFEKVAGVWKKSDSNCGGWVS